MDKSKYKSPSRAVDSIDVPNWGKVYIRSVSMGDVRRLQMETDPLKGDLLAVVYGACDESGKRNFDETDLDWLADVPLETTKPIVTAVLKHIKSIGAKVEEAKNESAATST